MAVNPIDSIFTQAPSIFDWNYAVYFGDGIPLLFWVFADPYPSCVNSNEYKWQIFSTELTATGPGTANLKTVPFQFGTTDNGANSFLKFPSNSIYNSNVLYNASNNFSSNLGNWRGRRAVIVVDSPWARSCVSRDLAPESDRGKNYAVGVSQDMLYRIANTYNTWDKWWNNTSSTDCFGLTNPSPLNNSSLLPTYLKQTLSAFSSPSFPYGGIQFVDVLGFKPAPNGYNLPNVDQAGIILPELGANYAAGIHATQCHIDTLAWPVNPFGKVFFGAFVAIYKEYDLQTIQIDKSLLIAVPWSGVLANAPNYTTNVKKPDGQCVLSCPQNLNFDSTCQLWGCSNPDQPITSAFDWRGAYFSPWTYPRFSCINAEGFYNGCYPDAPQPNGQPSIRAYNCETSPSNCYLNVNSVHIGGKQGSDRINASLTYTALDTSPHLHCNYTAFNISAGNNGKYPSLIYDYDQNFDEFGEPISIYNPFDKLEPWAMIYRMSNVTRQFVAGGACNSAVFNLF